MNTIEINPDTWTEISKDSCDVWLENNFELIKFANDDGIITSGYLTKPLRVISDTPIKAKSNKYTVLLYTTDNTNEEVLEDLNQAINNTLTANADKDLETKNALEAKDALLEQSIADNTLANSNLSTEVNDIDTRLTDLELNPVNNVNTSLPLSFWVGTQAELDLVEDRDANTVYIVQE